MKIFSNLFTLMRSPLPASYFLLDIETTGLLKAHDAIICIGIIYKNTNNELCSMQWFAEKTEEEKEILLCFLEFSSSFQKAYTYNGNQFDIPFIIARLDHHSLDASSFKMLFFLDIKKALSKLSLKRFSLEHLLGYKRQTTVTGKELTKLYKVFESTSLSTYQTIIIDHSLDELNSLLSLYEFYYLSSHLLNYKLIRSTRSENYLCIDLQLDFVPHTCCCLKMDDFHMSWTSDMNLITLKIFCHQVVLKKYLTPTKDYYLVKDQNQLIHKSIAQFIPTPLKKKATKEQCFITKPGTFIKLYKVSKERKLSLDIWYNNNNDLFIEYQESEQLTSLVIQQIKSILCP